MSRSDDLSFSDPRKLRGNALLAATIGVCCHRGIHAQADFK